MTPAHYASQNPTSWREKAATITQAGTFGLALVTKLFVSKIVGRKP